MVAEQFFHEVHMQISSGAPRVIHDEYVTLAQAGRQRARVLLLAAVAPVIGCCALARAATPIGVIGDQVPDFVYDPTSGDLTWSLDGWNPVDGQGHPSLIGQLEVHSASGQLLFNYATPDFRKGFALTLSPFELTTSNPFSPGYPASLDLGAVLPVALSAAELSNDLSFKAIVSGGGLKQPARDVVFAPAPVSVTPTIQYVGPSGDWSVGSSWSVNRTPAAGEFARIGSTATLSVNIDSLTDAIELAGVTLDGTSGGVASLHLSQKPLGVAGEFIVGDSGSATVVQEQGAHSVGGMLVLGNRNGANGSYLMSGGSLSVGTVAVVGFQGSGTFNQTGGSVSLYQLSVARLPGSIGEYDLGAGAELKATNENVLTGGVFNQSGGSNKAPSVDVGGIYNLRDGELTGSLLISGQFTQTGGTFNGNINTTSGSSVGGVTFSAGTVNLRTINNFGRFSLSSNVQMGEVKFRVNNSGTMTLDMPMTGLLSGGFANRGNLKLTGGTLAGPISNLVSSAVAVISGSTLHLTSISNS